MTDVRIVILLTTNPKFQLGEVIKVSDSAITALYYGDIIYHYYADDVKTNGRWYIGERNSTWYAVPETAIATSTDQPIGVFAVSKLPFTFIGEMLTNPLFLLFFIILISIVCIWVFI